MNRILLFIGLACLVGCSSKEDVGKIPERYLYFTSNFPEKYYWAIGTDFKATKDNVLCKSLSPISGEWVPSRASESYTLKNPGDTLKIPLFRSKNSLCGWEMTYVSTSMHGRRVSMNRVSLKNKNTVDPLTKGLKYMPDTVSYVCKRDSTEDAYDCEVENGETEMGFLLHDSAEIDYLHIEIKSH
jgi:hypothetical protein